MLYSKSVIEASAEGVLCVKVMTDEQMEVLRSQISAYAAICEQLVEMHRTMIAHQDSLSGMRSGHLFPDQSSGGAKISAKQRWTPTPAQNRRARSKRKQAFAAPSTTESEAEEESPGEKKAKKKMHLHDS
ncbi:hypothetical protein OPV22_004140 [Ensete ventricosum]|uniref:Uncharacterized protein n=1 Tax=Ensete ventricosum TaxID=4639 RepID=A0AAV8S2S4_ENSVE|nr:hypothetical protein OPV22_004140 [Ensete ventricosum]